MTGHDAPFWQDIYRSEPRPGWDMDGPTPLLAELLDLAAPLGLAPGARVAVPGCGFGHDAAELARRGFRAVGLDFAPEALAGARDRYGDLAGFRQEDWFGPGEPEFDAVFDHTCFAAMVPERRKAYVAASARRLRPGGLWLVALFHTVRTEGHPPYALTLEEARTLAEASFRVLHLDHARTGHPRRLGREFLMIAERK